MLYTIYIYVTAYIIGGTRSVIIRKRRESYPPSMESDGKVSIEGEGGEKVDER